MELFTDLSELISLVNCNHAEIFSPENHVVRPMGETPATSGIESSETRVSCSAATGFVSPVLKMELSFQSHLDKLFPTEQSTGMYCEYSGHSQLQSS